MMGSKITASYRFSTTTQVLHWLTVVLVLLAFSFGPGGSEQHVYSASMDLQRQIHETLGLSVLALVVVRVTWRGLFDTSPTPVPAPRWMRWAATLVQMALYTLLFALPLTAITGAWLEGHALTLLGDIRVPPALPESHAIGVVFAVVHTWLGDLIIWLAGLHASAALFHHYVVRDDVLRSMLPDRNASRQHG